MRRQSMVKSNYLIIILFLFSLLVTPLPAQEVSLAWTPNVEEHLEYYNIYRDTVSGTFVLLDQVPQSDSTYLDPDVESGETYFYKITAVGTNGYESPPSKEVSTVVGTDVVFGDVDDNGSVQAHDAALILQYAIGLDPLNDTDPRPWSDWRTQRADIDTDGSILSFDAALTLQQSIGYDVFSQYQGE